MDNTEIPVKAVINNERIECGCCGKLLFKKHQSYFDFSGLTNVQTFLVKKHFEAQLDFIRTPLEMKCPHRKEDGHYCNTINQITL